LLVRKKSPRWRYRAVYCKDRGTEKGAPGERSTYQSILQGNAGEKSRLQDGEKSRKSIPPVPGVGEASSKKNEKKNEGETLKKCVFKDSDGPKKNGGGEERGVFRAMGRNKKNAGLIKGPERLGRKPDAWEHKKRGGVSVN